MEAIVGWLHWALTAAWLVMLGYFLPLYRLKNVPGESLSGYAAAYGLMRTASLLPLLAGVGYWAWRGGDALLEVTPWSGTFQTGMLLLCLVVINLWWLAAPQERHLTAIANEAFDVARLRIFLAARFSLLFGICGLFFFALALLYPLAPAGGWVQMGKFWALVLVILGYFEWLAWGLPYDGPARSRWGLVADCVLVSGLLVGAMVIA